jgi:citrate synthase
MDSLQVVDSRTGNSYTIPIHKGDYIRAADIGQIKALEVQTENGDAGIPISRSLRILDKGFEHTACMESSITLV